MARFVFENGYLKMLKIQTDYEYLETNGIKHLLDVKDEPSTLPAQPQAAGKIFSEDTSVDEEHRVTINRILYLLLNRGLNLDIKHDPKTEIPLTFLTELYQETKYTVDSIFKCDHPLNRQLYMQLQKTHGHADGKEDFTYVFIPGKKGCLEWIKQDIPDRSAGDIVVTQDFRTAMKIATVENKKQAQLLFVAKFWAGNMALVANEGVKFGIQNDRQVMTLKDEYRGVWYPKKLAQLCFTHCVVLRADMEHLDDAKYFKNNPTWQGIALEMVRNTREDASKSKILRIGSKVEFKIQANLSAEGIIKDVNFQGSYLVEPCSHDAQQYIYHKNWIHPKTKEEYQKYNYEFKWMIVPADGLTFVDGPSPVLKISNKPLAVKKFTQDCMSPVGRAQDFPR
jgi:hypothetical protein